MDSDNYQRFMPLVTVIVPAYNHERFLEQRLESIFRQTFTDYEVILLDDGSTDGSKEILRRYSGHAKVSHVVFNEINSGSTFQQWKKGITLAKGEWIWIAESDDFCDDGLLEALITRAQSCGDIVLSYCQSLDVDETGKVWGDLSWHTDKIDKEYWKTDYCNSGLDEIKKCLWHYNSIPNASAVLFKKTAYLACRKNFEAMRLCGDWMLWVQLLKQGDISFCKQPHNSFRKHSATTRVMDDNKKIRCRFEEEYAIAADIKSSVAGLNALAAKQKLWRIGREYSTLFTLKDILSFLAKPWTYKKIIPLPVLSGFFFLRFFKSKSLSLIKAKRVATSFF